MRKSVVILVLLLLTVLPLSIKAQGSLCDFDLSSINATLTRAQAAAGSGNARQALTLIQQADQALADLETRCDLELIEPNVTLEASYTPPESTWTVQYPDSWSIYEISRSNFTLGSDAQAAEQLTLAAPTLTSGQQGALVILGTPAEVTGRMDVAPSLESIVDYFDQELSTSYTVQDEPTFYLLNGHAAASLDFSSDTFDGMLVVVEVVERRQYAVIAGAAAAGELDDFRETIQAIAASISAGEAAP